jgi:hypothetical protein
MEGNTSRRARSERVLGVVHRGRRRGRLGRGLCAAVGLHREQLRHRLGDAPAHGQHIASQMEGERRARTW